MSLTASEMTPADIAAVTNNNGNGGGWGNGMWGDWIVLFLLAAMWGGGGFGFGGGGFGGGRSGSGGAPWATQADLSAGFANSEIMSDLNDILLQNSQGFAGVQQTLCQGFSGVNQTVLTGFHGIDNAICTLGYQNQQGFNALGAQLAQCCCSIERSIDANTTQGVMNTNAIQRQISDCCCDIEKMNMQSRFDAQTYNCNTLQAIDKLGDRIIDYMAAERTQALRDENQALRLAASQARQNQYLIDELRPCPRPAYITCNPYAASYGTAGYGGYGYNGGCGCGCGVA